MNASISVYLLHSPMVGIHETRVGIGCVGMPRCPDRMGILADSRIKIRQTREFKVAVARSEAGRRPYLQREAGGLPFPTDYFDMLTIHDRAEHVVEPRGHAGRGAAAGRSRVTP